jgi:hypothetical protein
MDWGQAVQLRDQAEAKRAEPGSATSRLRNLGIAYDCQEMMV